MYFSKSSRCLGWKSLKPMEQRCAAQLFVACGGAEEWGSFDEWLAAGDVTRATLLDDGEPVALWFQFGDSGLLFDAKKHKKPVCDRIIGSAAQHGFVCDDLALWKALEQAQGASPTIDWKVKASGVGQVLRPSGTAEANWRSIQDQVEAPPATAPGDATLRYEPGPVKVWVDGVWEPAVKIGRAHV
jgi:hypothetical protein